jgi:hypothetical protein
MVNTAREHLRLEVRLMDEPSLWRWDIKDAVGGEIVESSWEQQWTGYVSREEALRAGRERLRSVCKNTGDSDFGRWRFGAA